MKVTNKTVKQVRGAKLKDTVEIASLKPCHLSIIQGTLYHREPSVHDHSLLLLHLTLFLPLFQTTTRRTSPSRTFAASSTSPPAPPSSENPPEDPPPKIPPPQQKPNRLLAQKMDRKLAPNSNPLIRTRTPATVRSPCIHHRDLDSSMTSSRFPTLHRRFNVSFSLHWISTMLLLIPCFLTQWNLFMNHWLCMLLVFIFWCRYTKIEPSLPWG